MRRRQLSSEQQHQAAKSLARLTPLIKAVRKANHIALYLARDGEINPALLMAKLSRMGKLCYLPVLSQGKKLQFRRFRPVTRLIPNRLGIPEPRTGKLVCARELDVVLMPLVGFDQRGSRLGMGGGFYDRSFSFKSVRNRCRAPRLIGLAHQCQRVDHLPIEPWDIPVWSIATGQGLIIAQ